MKEPTIIKSSRRDFITKIVPACSLLCIGDLGALTELHSERDANIFQDKHMFDEEYPKEITYKILRREQYKNLIWFIRSLQRELGKEKTYELLKKEASNRNLIVVKRTMGKLKDRSLKAYTRQFTDKKKWDNVAKIEVVEDTETVFQMKVKECIFSEVFRGMKAADIGYAFLCWGDYAHAKGFNPLIKMVRDKTLMQGHDCCNHRYIWTG